MKKYFKYFMLAIIGLFMVGVNAKPVNVLKSFKGKNMNQFITYVKGLNKLAKENLMFNANNEKPRSSTYNVEVIWRFNYRKFTPAYYTSFNKRKYYEVTSGEYFELDIREELRTMGLDYDAYDFFLSNDFFKNENGYLKSVDPIDQDIYVQFSGYIKTYEINKTELEDTTILVMPSKTTVGNKALHGVNVDFEVGIQKENYKLSSFKINNQEYIDDFVFEGGKYKYTYKNLKEDLNVVYEIEVDNVNLRKITITNEDNATIYSKYVKLGDRFVYNYVNELGLDRIKEDIDGSILPEGVTKYPANNPNSIVIENVDKEYNIKLVVVPRKYKITIKNSENGSVSLSPEKEEYDYDELVYITLDTEEGYQTADIRINGDSIKDNPANYLSSKKYQFRVKRNVTIYHSTKRDPNYSRVVLKGPDNEIFYDRLILKGDSFRMNIKSYVPLEEGEHHKIDNNNFTLKGTILEIEKLAYDNYTVNITKEKNEYRIYKDTDGRGSVTTDPE